MSIYIISNKHYPPSNMQILLIIMAPSKHHPQTHNYTRVTQFTRNSLLMSPSRNTIHNPTSHAVSTQIVTESTSKLRNLEQILPWPLRAATRKRRWQILMDTRSGAT